MAIEITSRTNSPVFVKTPNKNKLEEDNKAIDLTSKKEEVALTSASQEIQKTVESPSSTPVDINRVNEVKKALANGSYTINPTRIAEKMIQFEAPDFLTTDNKS